MNNSVVVSVEGHANPLLSRMGIASTMSPPLEELFRIQGLPPD